MASQLAGFLRALHSVPTSCLESVDLPIYDTRHEWAAMYERVQSELFRFMRADARDQVAEHFESVLDGSSAGTTYAPCLRHGDFGTGNIIYDPEALSIVGIVDFGSAGLGDPATDFAGLLSSYGDEFYGMCALEHPDMIAAMDRARFYLGTFALQEALFGLDNGDRTAFEAGMARFV
jgi:aminoglycoside 2''-phosphotransferase